MKIVHALPTGGWYGSENVASSMANLQVADHEVAVVWKSSEGFPAALARQPLAPGVRLVCLPESANSPAEQAEYVRRALPWRPDIIHAHLGPGAALARALAVDGTRWVASLHVRFFWKQFHDSDAVICISPWQMRDIPDRYEGKAFVVQNTTRPCESLSKGAAETFRRGLYANDETMVFGAVGRLHLEKGFDVLCRAFMQADLPNSRLAIIGDGPERNRLSRYSSEHKNIILTGYVERASRLMDAMDVYVSSARAEAFGMTILEAMQRGLPIISTAALGPRDLLAPQELVPVGDVTALAAALRDAHERRPPRRTYDLSEYRPEAVYSKLQGAYEETLRSVRGGTRPSVRNRLGVRPTVRRRLARGLRGLAGLLDSSVD